MFWDIMSVILDFAGQIINLIFSIQLSYDLTLGGVITLLFLASTVLKLITSIAGIDIRVDQSAARYRSRLENDKKKGCK